MSVYLDANIFPNRGPLQTLELTTISGMAQEHGLAVVLSELVVEEVVARFYRDVVEAQDKLQSALREASKLWPTDGLFLPDADELARERRSHLENQYEIAPLSADNAKEALKREVWRLAPARQGKGGRDAAIWLSVRAHHVQSSQPGYFVSRNTRDFAAGRELHPSLLAEVEKESRPFYYCESPSLLFARLGNEVVSTLTAQQLQDSEVAHDAVVRFVQDARLFASGPHGLPLEVGELFLTGSPVVTLSRIHEVKAYEVSSTVVTVTWSTWAIQYEIGALRRFHGGGYSQMVQRMQGECDLQLLIRIEAVTNDLKSIEVTGSRNWQSQLARM